MYGEEYVYNTTMFSLSRYCLCSLWALVVSLAGAISFLYALCYVNEFLAHIMFVISLGYKKKNLLLKIKTITFFIKFIP